MGVSVNEIKRLATGQAAQLGVARRSRPIWLGNWLMIVQNPVFR
jgi:hypothetical protein